MHAATAGCWTIDDDDDDDDERMYFNWRKS